MQLALGKVIREICDHIIAKFRNRCADRIDDRRERITRTEPRATSIFSDSLITCGAYARWSNNEAGYTARVEFCDLLCCGIRNLFPLNIIDIARTFWCVVSNIGDKNEDYRRVHAIREAHIILEGSPGVRCIGFVWCRTRIIERVDLVFWAIITSVRGKRFNCCLEVFNIACWRESFTSALANIVSECYEA